jgi:spermidine synthase
LGVGLLSAGTLAFELALTRIFAVAQFYHFAFMAVSLALLGSGASGSLLSLRPQLGKHPGRWAGGFSLSAVGAYAILNLVPFDSYAIAWDGRQVLYLVAVFGAAAVPFLFGGLAVSGMLQTDPQGLHRVYAANLAGSAVGCLAVLPVLSWLGAEGALAASAAAGLVAAALLARSVAGRHGMLQRLSPLAGATLLIAAAAVRPAWMALQLSPYKALVQVLYAPDARLVLSRWGPVARVDVVESSAIHAMPGLSENAMIPRPPLQAGLTLDGDNLQPVTALPPDSDLARELAANVPEAVVRALRPEARSYLVLEAGSGWSVLMALAGGAERVTAVERDPLVVQVLRRDLGGFSHGLYSDPRVRVEVSEGRTYVRSAGETYDAVIVALRDAFHPVTSGAYGLSEDYRYTVEALTDYLQCLEPDGVLVITRWLQSPPSESLRTLAAIEAALRRLGSAAPAEHVAAFRSLRTITLVVARTPLSAADREAVRSFVASRSYDLVWLPDVSADEVNVHIRVPRPAHYEAFRDLLADPQGFVRSYPYDIRPATDDRPFFYHYFRWGQTPAILQSLGRTWQPFGGSGYLVLLALLAIVLVLSAALIFGPLLAQSRPLRRVQTGARVHGRALVYFSMLGLGFLFVEIPLAQSFILFLGQPTLALAVVVFALLLFAGLGSLMAPRWELRTALACLVVLTLAMPVVVRGVPAVALGWPLPLRVAVAVASLAPVGVLMGVPFAKGIALLERVSPGAIPWAWAINGSASVIASVLAVMLAVSWGFRTVLWLGAGAYLSALVVMAPLAGRRRDSVPMEAYGG